MRLLLLLSVCISSSDSRIGNMFICVQNAKHSLAQGPGSSHCRAHRGDALEWLNFAIKLTGTCSTTYLAHLRSLGARVTCFHYFRSLGARVTCFHYFFTLANLTST